MLSTDTDPSASLATTVPFSVRGRAAKYLKDLPAVEIRPVYDHALPGVKRVLDCTLHRFAITEVVLVAANELGIIRLDR